MQYVCLLAVLPSSVVQDETELPNCSSQSHLLEQLSDNLKVNYSVNVVVYQKRCCT